MKTSLFSIGFLLICSMLTGQVSDGLVGYFPFTDGSFTDESGYVDGALSTSVGDNTYYLVQDRFGNDNCAIDFQGAVIQAGSNARDITSEVSISLWVKTTDTPDGHRYIITKYGHNLQDIPIAGYSMIFDDSVRFDSRDEDWRHNDYMVSDYSETLVSDGEWHHLVGVTKNSASSEEAMLEIWVDGVKEDSGTYAWNITELNNPRQNMCIGGSEQYNTVPTFKGVIDDIRIFNRPLDSLEIDQLLKEANPFVQPVVEISVSDTSVCANTPVQFNAVVTDADSIIWDFGDGSVSNELDPEHAFVDAGQYIVSATVINESSGLTSADTIQEGISVHPVYQDTVYMDVAEGDLPYQFGSQTLTEGGTYTVTFQTVHACDSIVTLHLSVNITGIQDESPGEEDILIQPNPSQGIFMVNFNTTLEGPSELTVFSMSGVEIFRKMVQPSEQIQVDLSPQKEGIYLLRIQNGSRQFTKKLVLKLD